MTTKKIIVLCLIMSGFLMQAQITPAISPRAILKQTVGFTEVEINYSRPSAKGRAVFGKVVPFNKTWRTGANQNTTISFSDDVLIEGKTLKKGIYALYTVPRIESWDVIFYTKTDNWGLPEQWNEADVALRVTGKANALPRPNESLTIELDNIQMNSAILEIYWENSIMTINIEFPTTQKTLANIKKVMDGPTAGDYFSSAQFLFQTNGDLAKSLEYVNLAISKTGEPPFYYTRLKSLIQAKLGDTKGAITTAKISLEASTKAKNEDYIKMNTDSIDEWSRIK